eukprot:scaffold259433_cov17-Tisochrysis_lutea.AAC.1
MQVALKERKCFAVQVPIPVEAQLMVDSGRGTLRTGGVDEGALNLHQDDLLWSVPPQNEYSLHTQPSSGISTC